MCCGLLTLIAVALIVGRHCGNGGCTETTNTCNDYHVNTTVHHIGDGCDTEYNGCCEKATPYHHYR